MELDAELDISLATSVGETLSAMVEQFRLLTYVPIPLNPTASAISNAAGLAVVNFGSPSMGRLWSVTRITVVGADDQTALAGSKVAIYVGVVQSPNLSDVLIPATTTVPFYHEWNKDQIFVSENDELYALIYGAGANQGVVGSATVIDYNKAYRWGGL